MITIESQILQSWIIGIIIPLTRILGFIAVAPLFSSNNVSTSIKVVIGAVLTMVVAPALEIRTEIDLLSPSGMLVITQQMIIGLAMGFVIKLLFSAIDLMGQLCGLTMGFGFASFFDPQSGASTVVITSLLNMLFMLVFVSMNGHLMMASALIDSFYTFPIEAGLGELNGMQIVSLGKNIFSTGLQLGLPLVSTLLITNIALGVLTKSAPQLNIFGIGFPITIGVGFLIMYLIMPTLSGPFQHLIEVGVGAIRQIGR